MFFKKYSRIKIILQICEETCWGQEKSCHLYLHHFVGFGVQYLLLWNAKFHWKNRVQFRYQYAHHGKHIILGVSHHILLCGKNPKEKRNSCDRNTRCRIRSLFFYSRSGKLANCPEYLCCSHQILHCLQLFHDVFTADIIFWYWSRKSSPWNMWWNRIIGKCWCSLFGQFGQ